MLAVFLLTGLHPIVTTSQSAMHLIWTHRLFDFRTLVGLALGC